MKQLYVKLQTPVIELPITATDPTGTKDSFTVGFKRLLPEQADTVMDEHTELSSVYIKQLNGISLDDELELDKDGVPIRDISEKTIYSKSEIKETSDRLASLVEDSILYLKGCKLVIQEDDRTSQLLVKDTREAKPVEGLWETPEECLNTLVGMYLESTPTRSSLSSAFQQSLLNVVIKDNKVKN